MFELAADVVGLRFEQLGVTWNFVAEHSFLRNLPPHCSITVPRNQSEIWPISRLVLRP